MQREYMEYVKEACENGMSREEVTYLFNDIYNKSNTKRGKKILKLFAQGIGSAKKRVKIQTINPAPQMTSPQMNNDMQINRQYTYFKQ